MCPSGTLAAKRQLLVAKAAEAPPEYAAAEI